MAAGNGEKGYNAFHVVAKNGNVVVLEWYLNKLIETGNKDAIDVNEPDKEGYPPLFIVCSKGHRNNQDMYD